MDFYYGTIIAINKKNNYNTVIHVCTMYIFIVQNKAKILKTPPPPKKNQQQKNPKKQTKTKKN